MLVKISNTVPDPIAVEYVLDYKGNANPGYINLSSYQYNTAGNFTILQRVFLSSGKIATACRNVKVYESQPVNAQYTSCGGGKVNLVIQDNKISQAYDQYEINWGDNSPVEIVAKGAVMAAEHYYNNTSASPVVKVIGLYNSNSACTRGRPYSATISFQQAQLGNIQIKAVEMRGDGSIRLHYLGLTAIPTSIQYSTDGISYITAGSRSSGGTQPYDIKGLNAKQVYRLKLSSEDLCSGKMDSKVISSMVLTGKSEDGKNVLTWNQYGSPDGFKSYDLLRDGTVIKSFTSVSEVTYTDEDVQCGSYSEYQIVARINDVTSTSAPIGIKAEIAVPKPIQQASVSVMSDNSVTIKAKIPGSGPNSTYDLSIEKAEAGSSDFKKIITLYNQNEYSDLSVKTDEKSYCYRLSYQNSCGQKLPPTQPICTILLKNELTKLFWNSELPILGGLKEYSIIQKGTSGTQQEIPVQKSHGYFIKLDKESELEFDFQVKAISSVPGFESFSNIISYRRNAGVFVPDAFTPDGNGFNDVLLAKSTQLKSFDFSVFNRWGEVIFRSNALADGWDGKINGADAPTGSYIYKVTFTDDINQTVEKSGTFMLLR
ncbi:gliding motility-associated C-terminal domain-containing protein [Dyadobacter flavalbus]|uniref:Gliding motility-associated C-terminal domain-containing protein n=1 Tax=Dyadobacter flavalbus TaxID=2579942 RepID=A0A5M8QX92_9BACT|nr:gliding motility-associated C-terminal domain-containing protein [Dyadobacter flavalbus]